MEMRDSSYWKKRGLDDRGVSLREPEPQGNTTREGWRGLEGGSRGQCWVDEDTHRKGSTEGK